MGVAQKILKASVFVLAISSMNVYSEDCGSACAVPSHLPEMTAHLTQYGHIDTKGLQTLLASGVSVIVLDARSGKWDDGNRIGTAKHLSSIATEQEASSLIPNKDSLIVVYCTNPHCPASTSLAKRLSELGYTHILKYEEGIEMWMNEGLPVYKIR